MHGAPPRTLRELFDAACELPPAQWADFLDANCPDSALRAQVASLLTSHHSAGEFLSTPAADLTNLHSFASGGLAGTNSNGDETDHLLGRAIGRYTPTAVLGAGGMGIVYRATQDNPRRTVALKVIRSAFAGPELLRRFRQEAEALGRLKHPGIAQIFEAGAAKGSDGRDLPFFAMELVAGRTLLEHCTLADLSTRERLELFARVCDAVSHAHQKGVIHRDLKPGNILVETDASVLDSAATAAAKSAPDPRRTTPGAPTPKILDFGVARLTDSDAAATIQTHAGQVVGTLAYMSPEQVRGDTNTLDTRSDVYALGVILYELLTGSLPYPVKGKQIAEAARIIAQDDPTILALQSRTLRGDVETIVLRALEKEPERRYQSAADLAADIRRHLADIPIVARPASAAYQLRKFARRNRILVAGVLGVLIALIVGIVGTGIGLVKAKNAQAAAADNATEARAEAQRARRTLDFVRGVLAASDLRNTGGKDFTMKDLLAELAARAKSELGDDPKVAAAIYDTISSSYLANSDPDRAAEFAALSEQLRARHFGKASPEYAHSLISRAYVERERNQTAQAAASLRHAVKIFEDAGPEQSDELALALGGLAEILAGSNDAAAAEPIIRRAIELLGDNAENMVSRLDMSTILADILWLKGDAAQAEAIMRDNIVRADAFYGKDHPKAAFANMALARTLQHGGKGEEAIPHLRAAKDSFERVYPAGHRYRFMARDNLAFALISAKQIDEAEQLTNDDLALLESARPADEVQLLRTISTAALIANLRKDFPKEESLRRRHVDLFRRVHGEALFAARLPILALAQCLLIQSKLAEASEILRPLEDPALDADPTNTRLDALQMIARWHDASENFNLAEETYLRALRIASNPRISPSARLQIARRYSAWLERRNRPDDAEAALDRISKELAATLGEENQYTRTAAKDLAALRQRRIPGR